MYLTHNCLAYKITFGMKHEINNARCQSFIAIHSVRNIYIYTLFFQALFLKL